MEETPFGPIIYAFTRKQAIEEGIQVRCPDDLRKEAGFTVPLFFTRRAWDKYVEVPKGMEGFQDLTGRLWDILTMLKYYARKHRTEESFDFRFMCRIPNAGNWEKHERMTDPKDKTIRQVSLTAQAGPVDPDDMSMCITISIPGED